MAENSGLTQLPELGDLKTLLTDSTINPEQVKSFLEKHMRQAWSNMFQYYGILYQMAAEYKRDYVKGATEGNHYEIYQVLVAEFTAASNSLEPASNQSEG